MSTNSSSRATNVTSSTPRPNRPHSQVIPSRVGFQEDTYATDSLRHILSLLGSLDGFGFTPLTSLSLNNRSRSKDLWVFTGLSQPTPPESQSSSALGSRTDLQAASLDKARERRRSYQAPAHTPTANNWPSHTRAATEHSLAHLSQNPPPPSSSSSKSAIVRKPAPRAQLPVSVAHSTASLHDGGIPSSHSAPSEELRMELQSSVGSAEDMTGVGTHKYGRTGGEPDNSLHHQASRFHSISPGAATSYYHNMSIKASQPSGSPQGVQTSGRTDIPSTKRAATSSFIPLRPHNSPMRATPQPVTPLLSPGAFRDSSLSSNTGQTADIPSTWPGAGRENGHPGSGTPSRDPKENVLPGGWLPGSVGTKEISALGDHPDELNAHDHGLRTPPHLEPEEQEVKVGIPELVRPRRRLARSGKATLVAEAPRADPHRAMDADRLPPHMKPTLDRRGTDPPKSPEGWVLVSVGQPSVTAPHAPKPTSQPGLRRKQSFPPVASQKSPVSGSPYSTGSRGAPTGSPVGSGHKKASSNPNPSIPPAAQAIVIFDAMQAKRKATSGDAPQSSFRKFFSLARPGSPKSSSKEGRPALSGGGGKGKVVEQEDNIKKRDGTWRTRGMPEVTKSDRRMSFD
jgi:hypothetical protein